MRTTYDKLIRDRLPEIIQATDRHFEVEVMDEEAYRQALRAKVLEEAEEVAAAGDDELAKEIADLLEVLDALCAAYGLEPEGVRSLQARRRAERGGFTGRLRLLWTES